MCSFGIFTFLNLFWESTVCICVGSSRINRPIVHLSRNWYLTYTQNFMHFYKRRYVIRKIKKEKRTCGESAISGHWYTVPLVQWSTRLLPIMRDPGSNPRGVLMWNQDSPVSVVSLQTLAYLDNKSHIDTNARPVKSHVCANCHIYPCPDPTCQGSLGVPRNLSCYVHTLCTSPSSSHHMTHYLA